MLDDIRAKIARARIDAREEEKLRALAQEAEASLCAARARLRALESRLHKEKDDLDRLDRMSLTSLFHTILGDKVEKRDKEREEFVTAKLRYDDCLESIAPLEEELAGIRERIEALGDPRSRIESLLAEKERTLSASGNPAAARLLAIAEELAEREADERELNDAILAGQAATASLAKAGVALRSAGGWGVFDLVGGGLITTAMKHSKIDDARSSVSAAQRHLRRFRAELRDVDVRFHVNVEVGGFATFADYFFDGLIADWWVQSKIGKSRRSVAGARRQVRHVIDRLQGARNEIRARREALEEERRRLIDEA